MIKFNNIVHRGIVGVCLFGLLLFSNRAVAQEAVYLPFFEAVNLPASYPYSITKLYKLYLEETGRYKVILAEVRDSNAVVESLKNARESAEAVGAAYFIMGELNRIGETIIVAVGVYNTSDGNKVWSSLQKAEGVSDIDVVVAKIARITGTNQKIAEVETINNLTTYDTKGTKTKEAIKTHGVITGAAFPIISNKVDEELSAGIGFVWSYDAGNYIFDIKAEGYFSETNDLYLVDINVLYPFTKKNNTPFVLGGMGVSGMQVVMPYTPTNTGPFNQEVEPGYSETAGGLIASIGGGYLVNRGNSVRLRLTLKGFYAAYNLVEGEDIQPFGGIFSVAVLFNR
jgi:hypothetical protein